MQLNGAWTLAIDHLQLGRCYLIQSTTLLTGAKISWDDVTVSLAICRNTAAAAGPDGLSILGQKQIWLDYQGSNVDLSLQKV